MILNLPSVPTGELARRRFVFLTGAVLLSFLMGCGFNAEARTSGSDTMKIFFERTGGFAGMRLTTTVDAAALPPNEAKQLHQLVSTADFFHLPAMIPSRTPQPDRFQYRLTVEENSRRHTVIVSEEVVPTALQSLIEWLMTAARQSKGDTGSL